MQRMSLVELPDELTPSGASKQPRAQAGMRFVMGIDGGATKTLAAVLDLQTKAISIGHGGSSNEDAVGEQRAIQALLGAADEAISQAGIDSERLGAAVLAVAGTDTDAIARNLRAARSNDWIVVNDVVGAWATATGAAPGVATISGTGSNVFGVGPTGRAWRAGGWGHLLGDEGSGYWLGVQSIKAALRDRECSGSRTELSEAALAFFSAPSVEALANMVYSKPLGKSEIAAFAVETAGLAEQGDEVARELYERGAEELGRQIVAVIRQTGLAPGASASDDAGAGDGGEPFPVGLIGSAFKAGPVFLEPLTRAIHTCAPKAQVAKVEMAPVGGSLLLAARACGREDHLPSLVDLARLLDEALDRHPIADRPRANAS